MRLLYREPHALCGFVRTRTFRAIGWLPSIGLDLFFAHATLAPVFLAHGQPLPDAKVFDRARADQMVNAGHE